MVRRYQSESLVTESPVQECSRCPSSSSSTPRRATPLGRRLIGSVEPSGLLDAQVDHPALDRAGPVLRGEAVVRRDEAIAAILQAGNHEAADLHHRVSLVRGAAALVLPATDLDHELHDGPLWRC
jgi:hypothetical protein